MIPEKLKRFFVNLLWYSWLFFVLLWFGLFVYYAIVLHNLNTPINWVTK